MASQAEVSGEGPLTTPPRSGSRSALVDIVARNLTAQALSSCTAYSIGSFLGRYKVQYIGAESSLASAPHETQAKTLEFSGLSSELLKRIAKCSGAHARHNLTRHADRLPSSLNHAQ